MTHRRALISLAVVTMLSGVAVIGLAHFGRIWTAMPRPSLFEQIRSWVGL
jgi:hypothetical protein